MKALNPRLTHEYGRGWVLCLDVSEEAVGLAKLVCDKFRDAPMDVQIEKWSDKRSIQANAYFHVLCDKIAAATKTTLDEVKVLMVQRYGTLARGEDGKVAGVIVPPSTRIADFYDYYKWYGKADNGFDQYLFFKRTHELNREEMSRLIDGTVDEAKALNIETMTPQELERMLNACKGGKE